MLCVCVGVFFAFFFIRENYRLHSKCAVESCNEYNISWSCFKVLEAQMKTDLAEKESLEAKRAQQEEESRENSKLISEQKAVRSKSLLFILV